MIEAEPIVFVVDDDPSIRRSMERLIQSIGFKVQTFRSAGEFLRRPRPDGPACLVLDVRLPGLCRATLFRGNGAGRVANYFGAVGAWGTA